MNENKKFNLKNRPNTITDAIPIGDKELFKFMLERHQEFAKWFKGFEARQRQNLADFEKAIKNTSLVNDPCFIRCWEALRNYIKLEVLGVEPKIKEEMKR
jgi:hypothetical protein